MNQQKHKIQTGVMQNFRSFSFRVKIRMRDWISFQSEQFLGWFSVSEARLRSSPDGDGVSEAREKFLHVEEARDLLQDESHVRVQIVHRAHLVVNADGWSQRVGERSDQICTVVVVWKLGRDRQGRRRIRHSMKVFTKASLPPALCWRQH